MLTIFLQITLGLGIVRGTQASFPETTTLRAFTSRTLQVPSFFHVGPVQCDTDGNLFFKVVNDVDATDKGSYVLELTPATEKPTVYQLPADLSSKSAFFDFYVSPSGELWGMVETLPSGEVYVVKFDEDGKPITRTKLDTPPNLEPEQYAVSDFGTMFISGFFSSVAPTALRGKSYAALFDKSGNLLTKLDRLSGSNGRLKEISAGTLPDEALTVDQYGNFWFDHSGEIAVISPSGELLRHFSFSKPSSRATVASIKLSANLLSISFFEPTGDGKHLAAQFLVLDQGTGEPFAAYVPSPELGNSAVCFSQNEGYTFMKSENHKVKLLVAPLN